MSFLFPLLAAAAASIATPTVAADETNSAPTAAADEPNSDGSAQPEEQKAEEVICKRIASGMDSRRKKKVCMTAREWRELNSRHYRPEDI